MAQHLDDGGTVGLVLHELGVSLRPLGRRGTQCGYRFGAVQPIVHQVQRKLIGPFATPDAAGNIITVLRVIEGAVPRLNLLL
jgi:hypothetical protein